MCELEKSTLHSLLGGGRGSGIYIFSGEPHFSKRGHKIFVFVKIRKLDALAAGFMLRPPKSVQGGPEKSKSEKLSTNVEPLNKAHS